MEAENTAHKKTYYITVGSAEILEPEDVIGNFELEILATEDEIDQLEELFDDRLDSEEASAVRSHIPFREYHHDEPNDDYDRSLAQIYKLLHQLGTPETKKHIESMNILKQ
ncbi:hypothetical protein PAESOLCIP111_02636 [Paenibacillus solanacearum]|uniref:Hydrolase n=1 Tax=Paenibacillus solanacearum TaxID=2048548 RepID=A0A916K3R0_9BACL|nr:hypothetical protein [Paenibacillus solanacearum]CAG7624564.1 hypothetical protein PAESOLCIP111_02636 [Paenibacillus solanacearum]